MDYRVPHSAVDNLPTEIMSEAVLERAWPASEMTILAEFEHVAGLTAGQRIVYTTMVYAREVDNGGLKQFLNNSSGMLAADVLASLKALQADALHEALKRVLSYFPEGIVPVDQMARREEVAGFSQDQLALLKQHEDRVYAEGGFESVLAPCWSSYISAHEQEFFLDA